MNKNELAFYGELLSDIKARVRRGQQQAALSANAEMTLTYWDVGRMIAERQELDGWGTKVIPRLAVDLTNELPEQKGFSERNIKRMLRFYREYPSLPLPAEQEVPQTAALLKLPETGEQSIVPQPAAQLQKLTNASVFAAVLGIPWFHNVVLIEKIKDLATRIWYARQAAEHGWSRDVLTAQIKSSLHERQGAAVTNFERTLPKIHAAIANGLLKDPFVFDFMTL